MRVLEIVHGWFPHHAGGTERYVAGLCRALRAAGCEVEILAGSDQPRERTLIDEELWEGIALHRLFREGLYLESWYHSHHPGAEARIRALLARLRPDLIHVHHWKRLTRNLVEIAHELDIPAVVTLHDPAATCPRTFRVRRGSACDRFVSAENCGDCVERFWFQDDAEIDLAIESHRADFAQELDLAAAVIAPSRALADVIVRQLPALADRIEIVEHGTIATTPAGRGRRAAEIRRLAVWGGLSPVKGTHLLVEAVARMKHRDRVGVDVWGEFDPGASRFEAALRRRAEALPIRFRGAFSPEDLPLDAIDLAVFPSVARESHSFTVDEAWAARIPVIVPDSGAPAERLAGRGATFRAESAADLARVLDRAVEEGRAALSPRRWRRPRAMADHAAEIASIYRRVRGARREGGPVDPELVAARRELAARRLDRRDRRLYDMRGATDQAERRRAELEAAIADREVALDEKERVLASFNEQLVTLTALIRDRDDQIEELGAEIRRRDAQIAELEAARRQSETALLETRSAFDLERAERDRAVADRDGRAAELEARLGRRDATIEEIQAIRRAEEERRAHAEAEAAALRERLASAEAEANERTPRLVAEAREALRASFEDERRGQAAELLRMRSAQETLEQRLQELRSELIAMREALEAAEAGRSSLAEEIESERAARLTLEEDRQRLRAEARSLEERLRRGRERGDALERERDDLLERTRRLERLNENLGFKRLRESSSLGVHQEALETALADLEELGARHAALEAGARELEAELRRRLGPIAAAEGLDAQGAPPDILEGVVGSHDRLHRLIAERDAIIRDLAGELDDRRAGDREPPGGAASFGARIGAQVGRLARRLKPRNPERLRLLVVVHDFLPRHAAGTEIYTYKLLQELRARHDVQLIFCEARHEQERYTVSRGEIDGLPYVEVVHNYQWESFEETYRDPRMDAIFESVLDDFEPDLVHIQHLHYFSMNFIPLAKARGLPVVYTLHEYMLLCARGGQLIREDLEICERPVPAKCADCVRHWNLEEDYGVPNERRALETARALLPEERREAFDRVTGPLASRPLDEAGRRLYAAAVTRRLDFIRDRIRGVDLFISPSAFLRQKFIDCGMIAPERIIHSDNGFDLSPFEGVERVPSERLRFGFVGTIAEYKGVHLMLEAFAGLEAPDAELHVWGDLETFQEYKERLLAIPRDDRVQLRGRFRNDRIAEVLAAIDVLIVPSLWFENSPLTIHEAWMAGIPVVASDRGGMAELVEDGVNGLHFRLGDADDLREKLARLAGDRDLVRRLASNPGPVKAIADNAREIEGYYRRLVAGETVEGPRP